MAKLRPSNVVFVIEYRHLAGLFDPASLSVVRSFKPSPSAETDPETALFELGFWNRKGFLERWAYKSRLIDALVGIDESRGYGRIADDFKTPVFVLGNGGLALEGTVDPKDAVRLFDLASPGPAAECGDYLRILNASRVVRDRSPETRIWILLYPQQPLALKALDLPPAFLKTDALQAAGDPHGVRIVNFLALLPGNPCWADRVHASAEGIDRITEALAAEMRSAR